MKTMKPDKYLFLFFLLGGVLLNNQYRNYVHENELKDFGLADMGASLVVVPALCFALWTFKIDLSKKNRFYDLLIITAFYCLLELLSLLIPRIGIFDYLDLIGYTIGALIVYVILRLNADKNV